jgi:hypothetical protein
MKLYDGFLAVVGLFALLTLATYGISKALEHADPMPPHQEMASE